MVLQQWWLDARKRLTGIYDEREASTVIQWLLEDTLKLNRTTLQLRQSKPLTADELLLLNHQLARLAAGEPLQYVTEIAHFFGYQFRVGPEVLIPRPETEELVERVLGTFFKDPIPYKLLDVGTGSGCIPITLQLKKPSWDVYALDVSPSALAVAKWNAAALGASVRFIQGNFLENTYWQQWVQPDILISNPPYIAAEEAKDMTQQVLDHEPRLALFPEGDDVLVFYKKLAEYAALVKPRYVFLELNPTYAYEIAHLFTQAGYAVELVKDMQGKDRILEGKLKI